MPCIMAGHGARRLAAPQERINVTKHKLEFDEIGYWSEIKLEIVKKYAQAYSTILAKQPGLTHYYIDGFAGPGFQLSKTTGTWVPGSPLNALNVKPPFKHHFLIDLDGGRLSRLKETIGDRQDVELLEGDCNHVLLNQVLPRVRYEDYRRALCLLDPYGLDLDWQVIAEAGRLRTIDLFLNFPIMDINRNALWTKPDQVSPARAAGMTRLWGGDSWKQAAYHKSAQENLFGESKLEKAPNEAVVEAFRERLRNVAELSNVPKPIPMRNSMNADVYYLFFASAKDVANKIVGEIFDQYRDHGRKPAGGTA